MKDKKRRYPVFALELKNGEQMTATAMFFNYNREVLLLPFRRFDSSGRSMDTRHAIRVRATDIIQRVRLEFLLNAHESLSGIRKILSAGYEEED